MPLRVNGPTMRVRVNGLEQDIRYDHHAIDDLLVPLLTEWVERTNDGRRHWAYLVAPPGAGKSTLMTLLERQPGLQIQFLGIDGFHYPQAYLTSHTREMPDGSRQPLAAIKGAAETFDAEELRRRIVASQTTDVPWPVYDRVAHDVRDNALRVTQRHVLLEGNWLLLRDPRWQPLHDLAEMKIFISCPEPLLRERLVHRKVQGGLTREAALAFYAASDGPNVRRVLDQTDVSQLDLHLTMDPDGSLHESDTI